MSSRSPEDSVYLLAAFRQGLGETGFIEGQNVAIQFRWAQGQYQRLSAFAADLVSRRVAVFTAVGGETSARVGEASNLDDSDRVCGNRSSQGRLGRKLQPPRRERDRLFPSHY
jgi:putative ABC transport system substrate-binding protein